MPRARDLEEGPVLLAERDLPVVAVAGDEREAEVVERVTEPRVERSVECGVVHCHQWYGLPWSAVTHSQEQSVAEPVTLPWRRRPERDAARFLSPAVRSRAADLGVDAAALAGSGSGGRVTRADVEAVGGQRCRRAVRQHPAPDRDRALGLQDNRPACARGRGRRLRRDRRSPPR